MSKKIKVRLYSKPAKKYIDYLTIGFSKTGELRSYSTENGFGPVLEDNYIVEQYTGLKDKNGKEIYEGDIVKWVDGLEEKHIFEIIWNECRASFQMVEIGQEYPYILQGLSDKMKPYCEVIGNIHENKEWLGGEE